MVFMIYTSSYKECKTKYNTYSISHDRGSDANYEGKCYPELAPKLTFWRKWKENIGTISEEENNRYYVEEYWKQVLSELDPEKVYKELDENVLLCYESNEKFCHRHILAAWFEILLGVKVPEIKLNNDKIEEQEKPEYIKQYLEDAMRINKNMKGFKSLQALYLFEKTEKLEAQAEKLEEKNKENYNHYKQLACFLRCDADMVEDEYIESQNQKKLIKK